MSYVRVLLTPSWDGEKITELRVEIVTDLKAAAGKTLFHINLETIFKPFTELTEPIRVYDRKGELDLAVRNLRKPPMRLAEYVPERSSESELRITYGLKLAPAGKNPVFDLGYEPGGMNGSGMTFMPAFHPSGVSLDEEESYGESVKGDLDYTLEWNLDALPGRAIGAWSFGEGKVSVQGDGSLLTQTFYAAGLLDSIRLGNFGYYWFPNPKITASAMDTSRIFEGESAFFSDDGRPYTIFARHTADTTSERAGGTALERSYMYLYLNDAQIDPVWLKFLFAHEMVHNWIHLSDEPFGTCTWYVEGMAEYYSAVLPLRFGLATPEELTGQLNKRARDYYENPARNCTNEECGQGLMADKDKTRVPYGRGFFYLTHADAAIRRTTGGEKCLDDVMRALNERWKTDSTLGNEAWIEEYGKYVGEETAREEYIFFRDGGVVTPEADCFHGAVTLHREEGRERGSGKACILWQWSAVDKEKTH